ncbi:Nucleoside triphosphate pyrophosphohydrolase [Petrocella atlantisensis]|uniref:Nucleoside triphosphate pyrophosphohydrolase n=1 Tax=Petrocella atlantisensis TaxID=2173034 RepID=A0A3P7RZJ9_9FIRM|nr:nucleoside triphosphate pyrophosphohydrolase [Petrocella atlantisensis]VDN48096.1 Nucleoside triphosphate pyrophosphohydrolase [Petrocella atlantisensis]
MINIVKKGDTYSFEDLLEVMTILRSEEGCPWDREQDHVSIKNAVIEEAYELVEAINKNDLSNLKEELGDLLLQVVFHSQIGKEAETFTIDEVVDGIVQKLLRRHPHVFDTVLAEDSETVLDQWDKIKLEEKSITTVTQDLRQVPKVLPALIKAGKVQKKVGKIGFDFPDFHSAFGKLTEEAQELMEAYENKDLKAIEEELGDLLFSVVNISRFLGLNPENALTNALEKFINRFEGIENLAVSRGQDIRQMDLTQMDALWSEVKKDE